MTIKIAVKKDLAKIVDIYNASISTRLSTADTTPVSVEDKQHWFDQHSAKRPIYVYQHNEDLIAWASFENFQNRPAYQGTAELSLYTDPAFREKGIGSTLLNHCINQSPKLGIHNLIARIFSHNIPSIRLFEKFNFEHWGKLPDIAEMDGTLYSVSIMGLKLNRPG